MIRFNSLHGCERLKTIYVENGFAPTVKFLESYLEVLPEPHTMVGNCLLWDLRALQDVVIPEGIEQIGSYWFTSVSVKSITVPESVRRI